MRIEHYKLNDKQIAIPTAESYSDCMTLIKSDMFRVTGKVLPTYKIVLQNLKPYSFSLLFWLRLAAYKGGVFRHFCHFMYTRASRRQQVQIPLSVKIGYGLYLGHHICMVVNPGTIIGNNVNLSQFLNIGTNHDTPAIIGDNVYIGPHVCIVEDVKIDNGSTIGAGAVVTKDIPENATAAGVPAKVLNYNDPERYIINKWEF